MVTTSEKDLISKQILTILGLIEVSIGKNHEYFYLIRSRILDIANDVKRMD